MHWADPPATVTDDADSIQNQVRRVQWRRLQAGRETPPMPLDTEDIVAYPVCRNSIDEIVYHVTEWLDGESSRCHIFACLNPHAVEMAAADPAFRRALLDADFLTPDGIGVVYASRMLGGSIRRRVTGMDVFEGVTRIPRAELEQREAALAEGRWRSRTAGSGCSRSREPP